MAGQCNYILTKNESERKMERFEIENSREFKAAQELARALNDYGWNEKRFALATTTFHQPDIIQDYCRDIESVCRSSKKDGPKK